MIVHPSIVRAASGIAPSRAACLLPIASRPARHQRSLRDTQRARQHRLQRPSARSYRTASNGDGDTFSPIESQILAAALRHVPDEGFSDTALRAGARAAGYLDASAVIFPLGPFEIVRYHLMKCRQTLCNDARVSDAAMEGLGLGARVRSLTLQRLRANSEVIHRWQDALALSTSPKNTPVMLGELAALADEIWYLAGDTAVDFSWYTKRSTLAAVYASSELFMTTDRSPGFKDTEAFLDRRMNEISDFGQVLSTTSEWLAFTSRSALNVARSKGIPI